MASALAGIVINSSSKSKSVEGDLQRTTNGAAASGRAAARGRQAMHVANAARSEDGQAKERSGSPCGRAVTGLVIFDRRHFSDRPCYSHA